MRKVTILLSVLCMALFAAAPASAFFAGSEGSAEGSLGISGYYELEGEKQDAAYGGTETTWASYSDDFELVVRVSKGNLTGVVDFVIADNSGSNYAGHSNFPVTPDDYWIEWAAMDNLDFKAGEYELNFGRSIGVYNAGGRNMGVVYKMDAVDLGLTLGKVTEDTDSSWGTPDDEDRDTDHFVFTVSFKDAGPFSKLDLGIVMAQNKATYATTDANANFIGLDFALPIGPVSLSGEVGVKGGEVPVSPGVEDLKGNYFVLEAGLGGLMPEGFGLSVTLFNSSKDYTGSFTVEDDYTPVEILFDEKVTNQEYTQAVILSGSYAVSDRLTVNAAVVPLAQVNGDQTSITAESGDSWGTEYDVGLSYQLADNITYTASYAKFTEGDVKVGDLTQYYNSVIFEF